MSAETRPILDLKKSNRSDNSLRNSNGVNLIYLVSQCSSCLEGSSE